MKRIIILIHAFILLSANCMHSSSLKDKMSEQKIEYHACQSKKGNQNPKIIQPLSKQKKITTTVLVYIENDSKTILPCLESILQQKHRNYHVICLVNNSMDDSIEKIKKLNNPRIEIIDYNEPVTKLECLYDSIHSLPDQNIIVLVDGRDQLENNTVLAKLHKEYTHNDTWLTFGASAANPQGSNIGLRNGVIPKEVTENGTYRKIFPYMPVRSFYAWLFKRIKKEDLINPATDTFYEFAPECYFIWPMVEMAATHTRIFTEKTYVVNCTDPVYSLIQDYHLRRACNSQIGRTLPVYQSLD